MILRTTGLHKITKSGSEERKENKTRGLETWGTSKLRDQEKKKNLQRRLSRYNKYRGKSRECSALQTN